MDIYEPTVPEVENPSDYARHMEKRMAQQLRCKIYPSNRPMKMIYHQFLWKWKMDFESARLKCQDLASQDKTLKEYMGTLHSSMN